MRSVDSKEINQNCGHSTRDVIF